MVTNSMAMAYLFPGAEYGDTDLNTEYCLHVPDQLQSQLAPEYPSSQSYFHPNPFSGHEPPYNSARLDDASAGIPGSWSTRMNTHDNFTRSDSTAAPPGGQHRQQQTGAPPKKGLRESEDPAALSAALRCEYPGCKLKDEDKLFSGAGAKSRFDRHERTHTKPFFCPDDKCRRHSDGFSRKDNCDDHIIKVHPQKKTGLRGKKQAGVLRPRPGHGVDVKRIFGGMSKKEQKSVVTFVLRSIQLWVGDENSDEDDDDMNGSEDEEGDDDDLDEAVGTGGGNAGR